MAKAKRKDKSRVVLRTGEIQRKDGTYQYSWTDKNKKTPLCICKDTGQSERKRRADCKGHQRWD